MSDFIEEFKQRVKANAGHHQCVRTIEQLTTERDDARKAAISMSNDVTEIGEQRDVLRTQLAEAVAKAKLWDELNADIDRAEEAARGTTPEESARIDLALAKAANAPLVPVVASMKAVVAAAREHYSAGCIVCCGDATEDDHYRWQISSRELHDALRELDKSVCPQCHNKPCNCALDFGP